jgi:hypothetical protein
MPLSPAEELKVPYYLFNKHLETIIPSTVRQVKGLNPQSVRLDTPDDDFVDVDCYLKKEVNRAVVISHGLEGSSDRPYVLGAAKLFFDNDWDVYAWNCRSCSGVMNKQFRLYHHGDIDDLSLVVQWVAEKTKYDEVVLLGFSMGGSMTLRYAGVAGNEIIPKIKKAMAFSVPVDLAGCSEKLEEPANRVYKNKFIRKLSQKIRLKAQQYPDRLNIKDLKKVKKIWDFDELFTAPIYGFAGADDFYKRASSKPFISSIRIPTLLVNALNDPFLPASCYPYEEVERSSYVFMETPKRGGHVGFLEKGNAHAWSERRALKFANTPLETKQ